MKTLLCSLFCFLILTSIVNAQYPIVYQAVVPVVVNTTQYVPYNYAVTNYYTAMVPVSVPTVQYIQVPVVIAPYVQSYVPFCRHYKAQYHNYQYYPYRY